jgi:hypothetical protein
MYLQLFKSFNTSKEDKKASLVHGSTFRNNDENSLQFVNALVLWHMAMRVCCKQEAAIVCVD